MTGPPSHPWPRTSERGQATVELVLLVPVFVLLALSVVQAGVVVRDRLLVAHAAREGARAAAVEPTTGAATAAAQAATGLDPARLGVAVTVISVPGGDGSGGRVAVTVHYRAPTRVPLVGILVPDIDLSSRIVARIE